METNYSFKEFNKMITESKQTKLNKMVQVGATLTPLTMITHNVYAFSIGEEFTTMMETLKTTIVSAIEEGVKTAIVGTGKWIFNGILECSYPICLTVGMIALILYLCGFKKSGKYVTVSFVIYVLLQAIKSVM